MEFDDDDGLDEEPIPPLLPRDDRLWRHPSEAGGRASEGAAGARSAVPAAAGDRSGAESRTLVVAGLASAVSVLLTLGLVAAVGPLRTERVAVERVTPASTDPTRPVSVTDVSSVAERVRPAIVQLQVTNSTGTQRGSGVVYRSDGMVLTSWQLVATAKAVRATLYDGREQFARVVGADAETGIAVLDLDGEGFPTAILGSAIRTQVGEPAITVGAPGTDGGAVVTAGVVSALSRRIEIGGQHLLDMLQIDRAIAPGCTGGAVIDQTGAVIAIAAANLDQGSGPLGFATPIDVARLTADQLASTGRVSRVWLGIEGEDLGGRRARELDVAGGVLVKRVKDDSPASRTGIVPADIILAVDGEEVQTMAGLVVALRTRQPGDVVQIEVLRRDERQVVEVLLTERPTSY